MILYLKNDIIFYLIIKIIRNTTYIINSVTIYIVNLVCGIV